MTKTVRRGCLAFLLAWGAGSLASADMATVRLGGTEDGQGVIRFDLSRLKGAKIVRADLRVARTAVVDGSMNEAQMDVEILPLFAASEAKPEGQPLAIRAPWFDRLDATDAVRAWASGKPNGGFYIKACPLFSAEATTLDIAYEGPIPNPPQQAGDVKAMHRGGQTFVTWKEIEDLVGKDEMLWGGLKAILDNLDRERQVRYVVYRHTKPITAATLADAEPIAEVKPASCWNVNGRSIERGLDHKIFTEYTLLSGQWSPFGSATLDGNFGKECPMERFVVTDGGKPLDRATGLYVHTVAGGGKACYAVVTMVNGVQNTADLSPKNVTPLVDEAAGEAPPVLQGEFPKSPFWNYRDKRYHYVRWEAPPFANVPSQYDNWSVAVPEGPPEAVKALLPEASKTVPLELSLHPDDRSYWRTQYRIEPDSIVVTPHDFPINSWWYGYHEALGTLKSFKQGVIQPYTERRVLWFVEWAAKKWPVDRNRILVTGYRRSGAGGPSGWGGSSSATVRYGFRHPEVFNLTIPGTGVIVDYAAELNPSMVKIWGKVEWGVKTDKGKNVWDELNLNKILAETAPATDLPPVALSGTKAPPSVVEFAALMLEKGCGIMANFNEWGGPKMIPFSANGTWPPPMINVDVRKNLILPAFGRSMAAGVRSAGKYMALNLDLRWKSDDIVDKAERVEITVFRTNNREKNPVTDVTLRRRRNFKVEPGKSCAWVNSDLAGKEIEKGDATVDKDGLLTLKDVRITDKPSRIVVTQK